MNLDDALQPWLARLRASWATSPLPGFFAWWGGELRACLPEKWRGLLNDHVETLLLDHGADSLDIHHASQPGGEPATRILSSLSPEEQRLAISDARAALDDPRVRTYLCLPRPRVLVRTLHLPAAAERKLAQVLGFEMDRQTPFKLDQVYLDQRIVARDSEKKTLTVELAVVPRAVMDEQLKRIEPLGLELDGVDAWSDEPGGTRLGFNFLPAPKRVKRINKRMWINLGLGAAALMLLVLAMNLWVANREQALAGMRDDVEVLQKQAKQVTTLREGLAESIKGASFLMRKKNEFPARIEVLRSVTHALDDETYLQRLSISEDNRISLQGMSEHAAALLGKVSEAPELVDASFQGVIRPDKATGKERFNILATVVSVGSKPPAAAPADTSKAGADADTEPKQDQKEGGNANAKASG